MQLTSKRLTANTAFAVSQSLLSARSRHSTKFYYKSSIWIGDLSILSNSHQLPAAAHPRSAPASSHCRAPPPPLPRHAPASTSCPVPCPLLTTVARCLRPPAARRLHPVVGALPLPFITSSSLLRPRLPIPGRRPAPSRPAMPGRPHPRQEPTSSVSALSWAL